MKRRKVRPWWALTALLPLGWFTFIGISYAAVRARRPWWHVISLLLLASTIWAFAQPEAADTGAVTIVAWLVGVAACAVLAPVYVRRLSSGELDAEHRVASRAEAQELARSKPEVARELGIGRPDVPGAQDRGLVDVNGAPVAVLSRLPGIDDAVAARIVEVREDVDGFGTIEELGHLLDLPADTVEDLRPRTVFIPR